MKVLHIANIGKSGKISGIGVAVMQLAKAQRLMGVDSRICSVGYNKDYIDNNLVYYTTTYKAFNALLENLNPDLITINGIYEKEEILFAYSIWKHRIPYVIVYHGSASSDNEKKNWLKKKIANFVFFNKIIRRAYSVVYLNKNEYQKSVFKKTNPKYSVIPNGVEMPIFQNTPDGSSPINIVFMSRLDYYGKGLDVLFPVIRRLYKEGYGDKVHFNFYGNKYDDTINAINEFPEIATYKGFVAGEQKHEAFIESSINILPSRSEGMPVTILDSLSYGKPCIVTKMTNMAELIEEKRCGWVVELTEESIYSVIIKAIEELSIEPNKYFENCRRAASDFSWDKIANQCINLYKEAINQ